MITPSRHVLLRTIVCLLASAASLHAAVLSVPSEYGTVQAAVDAAADGDVVLVAPGIYDELVVVVDKGITLVGDGGEVRLDGLVVRDLAAGKRATFRHVEILITLTFFDSITYEAVLLVDNAGTVHLEDGNFRGGWGIPGNWQKIIPGTEGSPGVRVQGCDAVVLARCTVQGGDGASLLNEDSDTSPTVGAAGLFVRDASVVVFESTLRGGDGGSNEDTVPYQGADGGPGLWVKNASSVQVHGSTLVGGNGGSADCDPWSCGYGGQGGDGMRQDGAAPLFAERDNSYEPGLGGGSFDPQGQGAPGVAKRIDGGALLTFGAGHRGFTSSSPVREGQDLTYRVSGEPGDVALLVLGLGADLVPLPGRQGAFLVGPPVLLIGTFFGVVPPEGSYDVPILVPELGPGIEGFDLVAQAAFDIGDAVLLGPVTVATLLSSDT